jgi:hypothetical protein
MSAVLWELAEQAEARPGRLAAILLPYARMRGWDSATLAATLGCSRDALAHLLVARDPTSAMWENDVAGLARLWGADPQRLIAVLEMARHHQRPPN